MQIVREEKYIEQKPNDLEKKKTDYVFAILILQMVTAGIIVAACFVLKLTGSGLYKDLSTIYKKKTGEKTSVYSVLSIDKNEDTDDIVLSGEYDAEISEDNETDVTKTAEVLSKNEILQPVIGTVTSEFGYRIHPISGKYAMHSGIDIGADTGTEIKCAYDGVVTEADFSNSYGYYIKVKHNDNFSTLYAHCSKLKASAGDKVSKGDIIALVGSTGVSTGAHLHFEVIVSGKKIDPRWLLSSVCEV